jgi:hypothetical protein
MINDMNISTDIAAIEPMDDTELQGIVSGELEDAVSYIDSDVSPIRAKGTEYYRGDPFGNEEDGRSQVVAMEVRDTVSAMLPSLMKVFFSSENVVEYVPRGPEDVTGAQQATDYANYVFANDNNGFMTTYALFKDSLVRKCGIAKYWWDEVEEVKIDEYSGLDDQTLQVLMQEGAEVKIVVSYPDTSVPMEMMQPQVDPMTGQPVMMPPPMLHDVQIKRTTKDGRIAERDHLRMQASSPTVRWQPWTICSRWATSWRRLRRTSPAPTWTAMTSIWRVSHSPPPWARVTV